MFLLNDYPISGQMGYQCPATKNMFNILELHDKIIFYLIILSVLVMWFFILSMYNSTKLPLNFAHGEFLEFIWTILPAVILCLIAVPSLSLLYVLDEILHSDLTVKILASQWYWSYQLGDYNESKDFDSFLVTEDDLESGQLRLLTTDNSLVLPVYTNIRLLVTSNDVIHSFAVPSLGLKCDAIPGRLNSAGIFIQRESTFYGQCSELCGVNHGFMPIEVQAVSLIDYINWLS